MRNSFENDINNSLSKMFNVNRNYINQEINRLGSVEQRSVSYRRNGNGNFGASQMSNFFGDNNFATIGTTLSSTTVM